MILTLSVGLYTSRLVLNLLGVEDFGIYSLIGGVVTIMTFLSGAMSSATQRFISFELAKGSTSRLNNIFKMIVNIHFLIVVVIILIVETLGLWFINTQLVIPVERLPAANVVFHCSLFSFCCVLIGVPYNATIIAYEKMNAFAYIGMFDVVLKLLIVMVLSKFNGDSLEFYAVSQSFVSLIVFLLYYFYSRKAFVITKLGFFWDKVLFINLLKYIAWNLFGNLAAIATNQGVNILLNLFFGTAVNAARAIAFQVSSAITGFVGSLQMAINPQIVKSYANDNHDYMLKLVFSGARYSFYLLFILGVPFLLKTDLILGIWLEQVPEFTVSFVKLVILDSLVISLSGTLMTAFQATGNIRKYQIVVGVIILCNLPLSYVFLKSGFHPNITIFIAISISILALFARVILLSNLFDNIKKEFFELISKVFCVFFISLSIASFIPRVNENHFIDLLFSCVFYWLIIVITIISVGIDSQERYFLINKFSRLRYIVGK